MIVLYLITLFIAPQLWIEPFVGWRIDLIIYPLWMVYLTATGRINKFFNFNIQDIIFLLMIVWILISSFLNETNILTGQIRFEYVKWFVLYRMVSLTLATDEGLATVTKRLLFIIFIIVIESIDHKYFSPDMLGWAGQPLGWVDQSVLDAGGSGRTQWINIFDGPGVFCVMFTLILPFLLVRLDDCYSKKQKFISLLLMVPVLIAIWTTGSRGGFLATLAIFGTYTLTRLNISFFTMLKIGGLLVVIFMMAPSHLTQIKDDNRSAQHRVDMWQEGVEMLEQNPVFGIGKGNYAPYTGKLIAHNSFIEIMGETGGPGIFLWVALVYLSFKNIYLYLRQEENEVKRSIARGLSICITGYLVSSFFVTLEYETLYFLLAITRSLSQHHKLDQKLRKADVINIVSIIIGMYIMLKVFIKLYY